MINFRFHLASLIAVFLALAIGIVMGSTVVKEATVKGLRAEIHRVDRQSEARARDNRDLRAQVGDLENYAHQSAAETVHDSLSGTKVVVVAVRGVDTGTAKATAELIQQAGASMPGILWLEPSWDLKNANDAKKLATVIGEPGASTKQLRDDAVTLLASRLAGPATLRPPVEPATVGSVARPDMLTGLASDGFVTFEGIGTQGGRSFSLGAYPGPSARVLVVGSTDASGDLDSLLAPLAQALVAVKIPTAVANAYHGQRNKPTRDQGVAGVRDDTTLSKQVSTVDDLELAQGQVAAVLALSDLESRIGHYGYGDGASAIVPPVSQP
ncbi:MAG TPA: copper transporter [Acidimicrobiia bacterium]|jgi:hypothetical protein